MLVNEKIEIILCGRNWKYYSNLGYEFTKDDWQNKRTLLVWQKDVPHGIQKGTKLHIICDYCGEDYYEYPYTYYLKQNTYPKDSCSNAECRNRRNKDIQLFKYGTTSMKERSIIQGFTLGRSTKYSREDIIKFAKFKNYTILSQLSDHITEKDIIYCICNIHNCTFEISIEGLIDLNRNNCPICKAEHMSKKMRTASIEEAMAIMELKDYTLISPSFLHNCDEIIEYICNKHQEYGIQRTSLYNLKHNEINCRLCSTLRGEYHPNWKGGISSERDRDMNSFEYKRWVKSVFERDNYTCQCCGKKNGNGYAVILNSHHICNYSSNVLLRTEITNGIALCNECHLCGFQNSFHSIYGVYNNNIDQLQEYFDIRRTQLNLPLVDIQRDILHTK